MNGLSKSLSDGMAPVARSKEWCGARMMPFLMVSLMAMGIPFIRSDVAIVLGRLAEKRCSALCAVRGAPN